MADTKITALTALTGANSAPGDLLTLVDVSDTTMDAAGTNKSITRQELQTYNAGTLTTDVKVLDLSATWNNAGVTFTGMKFNVTNTASNSASLLLDLQVGSTSVFKVRRDGGITVPSAVAITSSNWTLINGSNLLADTGGIAVRQNNLSMSSGISVAWSTTTSSIGNQNGGTFASDGSHTIAQRNSTNAQTFRLYNTYTDASNYERLAISWGSNIVSIKPENAGTGSARVLHISGLPTSNPGAGILWNNGGTPAIGT